jgi:hypothetical protein
MQVAAHATRLADDDARRAYQRRGGPFGPFGGAPQFCCWGCCGCCEGCPCGGPYGDCIVCIGGCIGCIGGWLTPPPRCCCGGGGGWLAYGIASGAAYGGGT